jgi:hypothetical protein
VSFDLWVRNEITLSINDAFRMPQSPQIGVETRNGWPNYFYRLWGWVGMVCRCPSLQASADGGCTSLAACADDPTERSELWSLALEKAGQDDC